MRRTLLLLASVLLAVVMMASDSPKEYDGRTEVSGLKGTWRLIKSEFDGREVETLHVTATFCGRLFRFNYSDGGNIQGSYRIDLMCKPPQLDLVPSNGFRKGQTLGRIYQIDGNTLRIAVWDGNGRLQGGPGEGVSVDTYKLREVASERRRLRCNAFSLQSPSPTVPKAARFRKRTEF